MLKTLKGIWKIWICRSDRHLGDAEDGYQTSKRGVISDGGQINSSGGNCSVADGRRGAATVEISKKDGTTLGIIIEGGADKCSRAKIASLRAGSIAHRSDSLCPDDYIISVNGIKTSKLKHDEIVSLLKNAGEKVTLEVEYDILSLAPENSNSVCSKVTQIRLEKEDGTFGFTFRGCSPSSSPTTSCHKLRPSIITYVRPGGPCDREGSIKVGDRLLAIDNISVQSAPHSDVMTIIKRIVKDALFTIEYDVAVMDAVRNATGPLLIEIDKTPGVQLGITLHSQPKEGHGIFIDSVKQTSVAERSGALHAGDQILAVDSVRVDQMTVAEVTQILKTAAGEQIRLEILPLSQMAMKRSTMDSRVTKTFLPPSISPSPVPTSSGCSTLTSSYSRAASRLGFPYPVGLGTPLLSGPSATRVSKWRHPKPLEPSISSSSLMSSATFPSVPQGIFHAENTEVTLIADVRGFGLALQDPPFATDVLSHLPVIWSVDAGGPAEKSGVIQAGDRVRSVNGHSTSGLSVEEVTQMILDSRNRVALEIEFDVAESIVPSSGTFCIKLSKRGSCLGIVITAPKHRKPGDPLIISDLKKGSIAHRTGTLQPGDRLLAIGNVRMENCTVDDAAEILKASPDIVKLRIQKDETFSEEPTPNGAVVYTVELVRHGGPLGITVSGSEEPFDPITISGLTSGGLAEQTGALHVGDRILAINGETLRGKPLSEAIFKLQNSGDVVTLKLAKKSCRSSRCSHASSDKTILGDQEDGVYLHKFSLLGSDGGGEGGCTPLPSVDSAVESWDSSTGNSTGDGNARDEPTEMTSDRSNDYQTNYCNGEPDDWDVRTQRSNGSQRSGDIRLPDDRAPETEFDRNWTKILSEFGVIEHCSQSLADEYAGSRDSRTPSEFPELPPPCFGVPEQFATVESDCPLSENGSSNEQARLATAVENGEMDEVISTLTGLASSNKDVTDFSRSTASTDNRASSPNADATSENGEYRPTTYDLGPSQYRSNTLPHPRRNKNPRTHRISQVIHKASSQTEAKELTNDLTLPPVMAIELHQVTLYKDPVYEDFGFSVSDGLYERGVYVNRIRPSGPADQRNTLKPYDRILQVNGTRTVDFDCCLTVPLIAAAGNSIDLLVARSPFYTHKFPTGRPPLTSDRSYPMAWIEDELPEEGSDEDEFGDQPNQGSPTPRTLTKTL